MEEPISRDQLFKSLEEKLTKAGLQHLIKRVEDWKVSFQISDDDDQKIRKLQNQLSKQELDDLIGAIRKNYREPIPSKPDWKESKEAKERASDLLKDFQQLMAEGKEIEITDYKLAVENYRTWVRKCSARLGKLESEMRQFGRNRNYKDDFEAKSPRICDLTRPHEESDREYLRLAISRSVDQLGSLMSDVAIYTLPDKDRVIR